MQGVSEPVITQTTEKVRAPALISASDHLETEITMPFTEEHTDTLRTLERGTWNYTR